MKIRKFFNIKNMGKLPNLLMSTIPYAFKASYLYSIPFRVQIEPTTKCNLDCLMCPRKAELPKSKLNKDMPFKDFKIILDKLPNTILLNLQGYGEPFLNKDIFDMIRYAKNKGIYIYTISNGMILTEEKNNKIIKSELDQIAFSVDGPTKKTYEKIRRGGDFGKVIKNISNLTKIRNESGSNLEVTLLTILNKENFNVLEKYIPLAKKMGVDKLRFEQLFFNYILEQKNIESIALVERQRKLVRKKIEKIKLLAKSKGVNFFFNTNKDCYVGCIWPWMRIYINFDGSVALCCNLPSYTLGNLLKEDLNEIWNNKKYQNFRKLMKKMKPRICERVCL